MTKHLIARIYRQNIEDEFRIGTKFILLVGDLLVRRGRNLTPISCCTAALLEPRKKIIKLYSWLRMMTPVTDSAGKSANFPGVRTVSGVRLR